MGGEFLFPGTSPPQQLPCLPGFPPGRDLPAWRQPHPGHPMGLIFLVCFLNLPGAFFIPYLIFLFTCGIPVFFLETALGQYTSQGGVTAWRRICPLFEGEWGEPERAWRDDCGALEACVVMSLPTAWIAPAAHPWGSQVGGPLTTPFPKSHWKN